MCLRQITCTSDRLNIPPHLPVGHSFLPQTNLMLPRACKMFDKLISEHFSCHAALARETLSGLFQVSRKSLSFVS